jgi:hypothetical protein
MAKVIKKAVKKPAKKAAKLVRAALVAMPTAASRSIDVNVRFTGGLGQMTATLFRKGILINMQSISTTGRIHFNDVQSRDTISINGECSGNARVTINTDTDPATPEDFSEIITGGYTIL